MADTLFLKFRGDEFEWLIFDSSGQKKADGLGSASEFNEGFENQFDGRVVFVAPGEEDRGGGRRIRRRRQLRL